MMPKSAAPSVKVCDEHARNCALDWLLKLRRRRPPKELLAELQSRPMAIEVDVVRDELERGVRHPIARALTEALHAFAKHGDVIYDEDMRNLSAEFSPALPKSGAPPYDPNALVDYRAFTFDDDCYIGEAVVPWLLGRVEMMIDCDVEPIPVALRAALERAMALPLSTRDVLAKFILEHARSVEPDVPSDIWAVLSQPGITIPRKPKPKAAFQVTFECEWDVEHGLCVLFDDAGRPVEIEDAMTLSDDL